MRPSAIAVVGALAACGPDAQAPGPAAADSADSAAPWCASGFDDAEVTWALPADGGPYRSSSDATCSGPGDELHRVLDLDGDRRPDLVRIASCDRDSALGDTEWWVHRNTGAGFAAEPTAWALPDVGLPFAFSKFSDGACENVPDYLFAVEDLTGDERPDLVVLSDCDVATPLGWESWAVYENTGGGFASEPTIWPAPAALAPEGWRRTGQDRCNHITRDVFDLIDVTGDDAPELVRTAGCAEEGGLVTTGAWQVWRNTGSGFSAEPEDWALPTDHGGDGWPGLSGSACQGEDDHLYRTMDLDGDDLVDLVVTSSCDRDAAWDVAWRVYPGSGAGFGSAVDWPVPAERAPGAFQFVFDEECVTAEDRKYRVTDVNADGLPDLVKLGACGPELVPASWDVFVNEGDRWAEEPVQWWLPDDTEPRTWVTLADRQCDDPADALLDIFDLDGDTLPDVVETWGCSTDSPTGVEHWTVRPGTCPP